jgi:hypothetical protein
VAGRLSLHVDDELPEVVPEAGVGDWEVADLPALREHREPLSIVVEVLELDALQRALAESVVEQKPERQFVAEVGVRREDRGADIGGERGLVNQPKENHP